MTSEHQELNDFICANATWLAGAKNIDLFRDLQEQSVNIFMKYRDNAYFNSTLNIFRQVLDDPEFQRFEREASGMPEKKKNKHKSKKERKEARRKREEVD